MIHKKMEPENGVGNWVLDLFQSSFFLAKGIND